MAETLDFGIDNFSIYFDLGDGDTLSRAVMDFTHSSILESS
jgi:hypothetical protein